MFQRTTENTQEMKRPKKKKFNKRNKHMIEYTSSKRTGPTAQGILQKNRTMTSNFQKKLKKNTIARKYPAMGLTSKKIKFLQTMYMYIKK